MDMIKEAKKYLNKYFKSQYIKEDDQEFKSLVRLLNKVNKQSNWIDVNERLPVFGEIVLVCTSSNYVFEAKCHELEDFNNKKYITWMNKESSVFGPTHWMPLPEPHKNKKQ